MKRKIVLTDLAKYKLKNILFQIEKRWSKKVSIEFVKNIKDILETIQFFPDSFPKSKIINDMHRCIISKQTSMYNRYDQNFIYILNFVNNRQNPVKIETELNLY